MLGIFLAFDSSPFTNLSMTNHWANVKKKPWENPGKTLGKPWKNPGKTLGKPWENGSTVSSCARWYVQSHKFT